MEYTEGNVENVCACDLEKNPMSVTEIMLFNITNTGDIAAEKLCKKLLESCFREL